MKHQPPSKPQGVYVASEQYGGPSSDLARLRAQAERVGAVVVGHYMKHGLRDGMAILDVGCGTGAITRVIAATCPASVVTGVDREAIAIQQATAESAPGGPTFLQADAYSLPFEDASFDAVCTSLVMMHLSEPARALNEFKRVLAPGGRLLIVDSDDAYWVFEPSCPAFEKLKGLLAVWQKSLGGSRTLGRKLPRLLEEAGMQNIRLDIQLITSRELGEEGFAAAFLDIFTVQSANFIKAGLVTQKEASLLLDELLQARQNKFFATIAAVAISGSPC